MTNAPLDALLDGPRGRRLCLSLLDTTQPLGSLAFYAARSPAELPALVGAVAEASVPLDAASLLDALETAVSTAAYWQPPDETDVMLQHPALRAVLEPVARLVAGAAEAAWWSTPLAEADQHWVQWTDISPRPLPSPSSTVERLAKWKEHALADERRAAERPADVTALFGGEWWSMPAHAELITTTRSLPGLGAAKLRLVEDGLGWTGADVTPLRPLAATRTFEITGPAAWVELVGRYPLEATLSRRHEWWQVTGRDGGWVIPDWQAVASDFDAVHLTVAGYLLTAGRSLPVGGAATMLAGWGPDETYWLGDVLEPAGAPTHWQRDVSINGPWSRR
jgi:hypothetical protein